MAAAAASDPPTKLRREITFMMVFLVGCDHAARGREKFRTPRRPGLILAEDNRFPCAILHPDAFGHLDSIETRNTWRPDQV
jgi:hypothetical protein